MYIIWSNEMSLAIALVTEVDEEEFISETTEEHIRLTSEEIYLKEWIYSRGDLIHKLEII